MGSKFCSQNVNIFYISTFKTLSNFGECLFFSEIPTNSPLLILISGLKAKSAGENLKKMRIHLNNELSEYATSLIEIICGSNLISSY